MSRKKKVSSRRADAALEACRKYTELREEAQRRRAAKRAEAEKKEMSLEELKAKEPFARTIESRRWFGRQIRKKVAEERRRRRVERKAWESAHKETPEPTNSATDTPEAVSTNSNSLTLPPELARGFTRTTENQKIPDPCPVDLDDPETKDLLENDEFASYFKRLIKPQLMVTTCKKPCPRLRRLIQELQYVIPNFYYFPRGDYKVSSICKFGVKHGYTDVLVFTQSREQPYGLWVSHLPEGPTSFFRISSVKLARELQKAGEVTDHRPEVIFNNFESFVGLRAMKQLMALFPQDPEFRGRRVITFHNQRDFIFFRHHRYVFAKEGERTRLQEIGPRFTLKLYALHKGVYDPINANYEYYWRAKMNADRKAAYM